jgi:hypothetical protein
MQNVKITRKGKKGPVPARLFMLLARKSPTAVIFRRGPSKWVQLLSWNTRTDTFSAGQWFHGRIYERRADLSPNGSLLVYFAQKIEGRTLKDADYTYAWTAVSRPPYLTALAVWPKGDCWHGGGLFKSNKTIVLNHKSGVAKPHPKHLPRGLRVTLKKNVHGEDDPLFSERLERDGWTLKQEWRVQSRGYPEMFETLTPEIREKRGPKGLQTIQLRRSIESLDYSEEFAIIVTDQSEVTPIDRASWVDWDQQGRLVFARDGKIFSGRVDKDGHLVERELIDLNPSKPEPVPAPDWATKW